MLASFCSLRASLGARPCFPSSSLQAGLPSRARSLGPCLLLSPASPLLSAWSKGLKGWWVYAPAGLVCLSSTPWPFLSSSLLSCRVPIALGAVALPCSPVRCLVKVFGLDPCACCPQALKGGCFSLCLTERLELQGLSGIHVNQSTMNP